MTEKKDTRYGALVRDVQFIFCDRAFHFTGSFATFCCIQSLGLDNLPISKNADMVAFGTIDGLIDAGFTNSNKTRYHEPACSF